jgi:uncharacterized protein (TIGR00730 family)
MDNEAKREAMVERILQSPSYRPAYKDIEFLSSPELRPTRMELELMKPELAFREYNIRSTIVTFGSTRILEPGAAADQLEQARRRLADTPRDARRKRAVVRAERLLAKSRYWEVARQFAKLVATTCSQNGQCDYVILTGAGPGIMEAANRGAHEAGAKSIGLNIHVPSEQVPNPYVTPELCFQFHYFALRKFHFLLRAKALVVFPGGFGTLDELFDALTLRQTHRMQDIPIIMFGREYWERVIDFQFLADEGAIDDADLDLFRFAEEADEAWEMIRRFHHHPE